MEKVFFWEKISGKLIPHLETKRKHSSKDKLKKNFPKKDEKISFLRKVSDEYATTSSGEFVIMATPFDVP